MNVCAIIFYFIIHLIGVSISSENYHCIWYGECHTSETGLKLNCPTTDSSKLINNNDAEAVLRRRCPHLFTETSKI